MLHSSAIFTSIDLAFSYAYGRRCRAMAKSARCLTMNLCDFDTTIGRISDGEFTGFVCVREAGSVVLALSAKLARKTNTNWQLTLTATIHGSQRQRCWKCRCRPRTWNTFVDSSAVVGVLMMDPAVNNSWIGKLLTARTNAKEMTARLRVSYTSSIDCFAMVTGSASLTITLNSLTITCHDSHCCPVALLWVWEYQCHW